MTRIEGLNQDARGELMRRLTVANPAIAQARRFSGFVSNKVPRHLYGYALDGETLVIAAGFASQAREWLIGQGWDVIVAFDQPQPAGTEMAYNGDDRAYQGVVVAKGSRRQGYFVAPCGSGKTDMGVRLIAKWGVPTLVIVHTRELMRQWCERIKARLGFDAHTFGGGKKRGEITGEERVIVATVQMLRRAPALMTQLAICRKYVIVDECHHTPAATFSDVLAQLNPWVRHGFTATEHRTDGLSAMLQWWIGPKLAEIPREMLEDSGHIVRPTLRVLTTRFRSSYDPDEPGDYSRLLGKLHDDKARIDLIVRQIGVWHESRRVHIVLTGSIDYGYRILDALLFQASNSMTCGMLRPMMCHGQMGKADRAAALDAVKAGTCNVIIATSLADEGLDLPQLTDLWTVTPTRSESKAEQRAGRICRPHPGKPVPRIHDIVDPLVSREVIHRETGKPVEMRLFVNQFKNRFIKCYRRIADYDARQVQAVLNGGEV